MNKLTTQDKTGKPIPINWAKKIAADLGYTQVIIHGYDGNTGIQHVTTFGKSIADCDHAAKGGNVIKKLLGFPEEACKSVPARILDGQCQCGHKHSEHHPISNDNYSAGHCKIGECRCKHFNA